MNALRWVPMVVAASLLVGCDRPGASSAPVDGAPMSETEGPLPALPDVPLDRLEPSVREQIRAAFDAARARREDAATVGSLAMHLHAYGLHRAAETAYRRAARFDADEPRWSYGLGVILADRGAFDEAASAFERVLRQQPDDAAALLRLADVQRQAGEPDAAKHVYERALATGRNEALARAGLGQALRALGERDAAAAHLRQAVALQPRFGRAHYALALTLRDAGRVDEAAEHFAAADAHDGEPPRDDPWMRAVDALAGGAVTALHRGIGLAANAQSPDDLQRAVDLFREAVQRDPDLVAAHSQLGTALLAIGDAAAAEASLRRALQLDPQYVDALYNLGLLCMRTNRFGEAASQFARALEQRPTMFEAHFGLGMALLKDGRGSEAEAPLREAVRLQPDDSRAYQHLNTLLSERGAYAEAVALLRQRMAYPPTDLGIAMRLAWHLATAPDEALREAEEAVELAELVCRHTQHPRALDTLAAAYANVGRFEEAVATIDRALAAMERSNAADVSALRVRREAYLRRQPWRQDA